MEHYLQFTAQEFLFRVNQDIPNPVPDPYFSSWFPSNLWLPSALRILHYLTPTHRDSYTARALSSLEWFIIFTLLKGQLFLDRELLKDN